MSRGGQARLQLARRAVLRGLGVTGMSGALPGLGSHAVAGPKRHWGPVEEQPAFANDRITQIANAPGVERAMLYEEEAGNPSGVSVSGSAVWRLENLPPQHGGPQELSVKADVAVPERDLLLQWSLRRNDDKSLPASHTVDFLFTLPADFRHRGISKVPGLLMKLNADERGTPLAGLSVKVTSGYFLIGLSARPGDTDRNIQLLKERPWLSVPIVYEDGKRAILVFAKGEAGTRALNEAFAAWGSTVSREKSAPPDQKNDRVPRRSPFPPEIIQSPGNLPR